jgi:dTMP kinase
MKKIPQGFLLVLEGIDGSGKTTLAQRLAHMVQQHGYDVVVTREPGGTEFGKNLRQLLQHSAVRPIPEAEFLLFAADRMQHITTVVKPALAGGQVVISDRMADSSMAYQGYGRGIDRARIASVNQWALQDVVPDVIIYIKLDWQAALQRIEKNRGELTAFEKEKQEFFERVAHGFDTIFKEKPQAITLDGRQTPDELFAQASAAVMQKLSHKRA